MGLLSNNLDKLSQQLGLEKRALNFQALRGIARNRVSDYIMGVPNAKQRLDLFMKRLGQRKSAITNSAYTSREAALRNAHINKQTADALDAPLHVKEYANKQIQRAYDRMNSAFNDVSLSDLINRDFRTFRPEASAVLRNGNAAGQNFTAAYKNLPLEPPPIL